MNGDGRDGIYLEVEEERLRQDAKWGEQNHPDGTCVAYAVSADWARSLCEHRFAAGIGTWADIFREEAAEALAEVDPTKLRAELVQVIAVATAWVEAIDRRAS